MTELALLLILVLLLAIWVSTTRVAGLLQSVLNAQMEALENAQRDRKAAQRKFDREVRRQEVERLINACPLCKGARSYYGSACIYCLGYGEAKRTEEADARFQKWADEVRQRWTLHFGMPY